MSPTITLPACIAQEIANLEDQITKLRDARTIELATIGEAAKDRFPKLVGHLGIWPGRCCIYIYPDSFDQAVELLRVVRAMSGLRMVEKIEDAAAKKVVWVFGGELHVYAVLAGETCKFVEVGKQVVPLYAIRCGDAAAPEEIA